MVGGDGRVIKGRYRVDREIGAGTGTRTLLVTDLKTARPCVLRTLREAATAPDEARRLEARAAVLARLDHPVIPRFVEYFVLGEGAEREHVLVVRYHPGESLDRLVAKERPLTEAQAIALLRRLVPALVYLHGLEPPLVHRSIKPSNVIVGPDGRPCLADLDFVLEGVGEGAAGTPPCEGEAAGCAPEATLGAPVPASDIYSLGVATIYAMSGEDPATLPREGGRMRIRDVVRAGEGFLAVLSRMVEPSLERRYPDARALDADLARLGAGYVPARLPTPPAAPGPAPAGPAPAAPAATAVPRAGAARRRPALPLVVVLAAVLLGAGAFWYLRVNRADGPSGESLVVPPQPAPAEQAPAQAPEPPAPAVPGGAPEAPAPPPAGAFGETRAPQAPAAVPEALSVPAAETSSAPPATPAPADTPGETPSVEGSLLFEGGPVDRVTAERPIFWFRNQQTAAAVKPRVEYDRSAFRVYGLPEGRFGVSARFDLEPRNPGLYPGDLDGHAGFVVAGGSPARVEIPLRRIIHLTRPVDNGAPITGWEVPCGAGSVLAAPVLFAWESLGSGTTYEATVERVSCARGGPGGARVLRKTLTELQVGVDLPPNAEGEYYSFRLSARREGRPAGILTTHGAKGVVWEHRFTVK